MKILAFQGQNQAQVKNYSALTEMFYYCNVANGYCNADSIDDGTRGVFLWNETIVNSTVRTSCFYGPPEVDVVRFCSSRNNLTTPDLEMCRTIISSRFIELEENVR